MLRRGQIVGWVQTSRTDDAVFVVQLFVEGSQREGIGTRIMKRLIGEAANEQQAVTLAIVKGVLRSGSITGWSSTSRMKTSGNFTCAVLQIEHHYDDPASDKTST
ncbi:MAG: hypothetical protein J2P48_12765 [Alphaproteobacteria bacterium]|nr:hypothetical protein [Alphaproteobacteria bacterium]